MFGTRIVACGKHWKAPFMASAPSSQIIVTTRLANVASTMRLDKYYSLKHLCDEDCWSVVMMHATEGRVSVHQFSEIIS